MRLRREAAPGHAITGRADVADLRRRHGGRPRRHRADTPDRRQTSGGRTGLLRRFEQGGRRIDPLPRLAEAGGERRAARPTGGPPMADRPLPRAGARCCARHRPRRCRTPRDAPGSCSPTACAGGRGSPRSRGPAGPPAARPTSRARTAWSVGAPAWQMASAPAAPVFPDVTQGVTEAGGMIRTSCPGFRSSRGRKCAPAQASIPMARGCRSSKQGRTPLRRNFRRTIAPCASTPPDMEDVLRKIDVDGSRPFRPLRTSKGFVATGSRTGPPGGITASPPAPRPARPPAPAAEDRGPPRAHAVHLRIGASEDPIEERRKFRLARRRRAGSKRTNALPSGPFGVAANNGIARRLPLHARRARRIRPAHAVPEASTSQAAVAPVARRRRPQLLRRQFVPDLQRPPHAACDRLPWQRKRGSACAETRPQRRCLCLAIDQIRMGPRPAFTRAPASCRAASGETHRGLASRERPTREARRP